MIRYPAARSWAAAGVLLAGKGSGSSPVLFCGSHRPLDHPELCSVSPFYPGEWTGGRNPRVERIPCGHSGGASGRPLHCGDVRERPFREPQEDASLEICLGSSAVLFLGPGDPKRRPLRRSVEGLVDRPGPFPARGKQGSLLGPVRPLSHPPVPVPSIPQLAVGERGGGAQPGLPGSVLLAVLGRTGDRNHRRADVDPHTTSR